MIYDDVGKPIKIEQKRVEKVDTSAPKGRRLLVTLVSVLCAVCLLLGFSLLSFKNDCQKRFEKQNELIEELNTQLDKQNNTIDKQAAEISSLREYFDNKAPDSSDKISAEELIERVGELEEKLADRDKLLAELKAQIEDIKSEGKNENAVVFILYTVQSGYTLSSIYADNGIDYSASISIILSINGIEDANRILVGQNILLPIIQKAE